MLPSVCHHWHPEPSGSSHSAASTCFGGAAAPTAVTCIPSNVSFLHSYNHMTCQVSKHFVLQNFTCFFFFLTFYPSSIWEVKCFWQWQRKAATLSSRCILILRLWQPWQYNSWLYSGITAFCRKRSVGKNLLEHVFEGYRSNGPKRQTNWCFK